MVENTPGYRIFLEEFIRLYRSEPSLWQVKSPNYTNRQMKEKAYEKLVVHYKKFEPDANRETVVKKINSLRTAYRKELVKYRGYQAVGADYKPRLWYYRLFGFLRGEDREANISDEEQGEENGDVTPEPNEQKPCVEESSPAQSNNHFPWPESSRLPWESGGPDEDGATAPGRLKRRADDGGDEDESEGGLRPEARRRRRVRAVLHRRLQEGGGGRRASTVEEDRWEVLGRMVAVTLGGLPREQGILAERLIGEVLCLAQLGCLTVGHGVTTGDPGVRGLS